MAADGEEKRAAQDDRDSWKRTGVISGALGSVLSLGAASGAAAAAGVVVGGPVLALGILFTISLKVNADLKTVEAERKVEDPPRADFWETTVPVMVLPFRDGFGSSELERALSALTRMTIETVSLESAMVTAEERMLGARSFGAEDAAEYRWMENMELRAAAGRWNLQLAHQSRSLAQLYRRDLMEEREFRNALQALEDFPREDLDAGNLQGFLEEVYPQILQTLIQAGFPPISPNNFFTQEGLESPLERAVDLSNSLEEAADAAASYGEGLLSSVEPDLPGSPPPLSFDPLERYPRYRRDFWSRRYRRY